MRQKIDEQERLKIITENEVKLWSLNKIVGGMDEAGRGPLAGPVSVACAVMRKEPLIEGINDSKKLSAKKRDMLYERIIQESIAFGSVMIPPEVIDEINILNAVKLGFEKAYENAGIKCDCILADYVPGLQLDTETRTLVHGDAISYSIAAASIIAKVERDRYMLEQHELYPMFNFASNKGYGTAEHIAALKKYGPCPIHRRSFIGRIMGYDE